MAEAAETSRGESMVSRIGDWLRERAYQIGREKCPWCKSTPVHAVTDMVVFTNRGYRFPTVRVTYCLMCEQLLYADLVASDEAPCRCESHIESDIAESDTIGLKNPHRLTDIVFSSCSTCGNILGAQVHY